MFKRIAILLILVLSFVASALYADQQGPASSSSEQAEQEYINKLNYQRNKLSIVVKTRVIGEKRSYATTDIYSTSYSYEAFSQTYGSVATTGLQRSEEKEITDWFIYKGGIRELSDIEFLELLGDQVQAERVRDLDNKKTQMRTIGNAAIGLGLLTMIGGVAFSSGQTTVTAGAVTLATGFFISAFNQPPHHYLQPDYVQEKIDEYNIALKRKLNLPLTFE